MIPGEIQAELNRLQPTYLFDGSEDKGANGWVYFATNRVTGAPVAIKFYWWGNQPDLHAEPRALALFDSPYIVPILAAELVGGGWSCFICPRFSSDLELLISRSQVSVHQALDISMNILSGLTALHAKDIVHRDLKPANILVADSGLAAIGDFGSVASLSQETMDVSASKHSIIYRPPESFRTGRFTKVGDLYQVAVVLYELLCGALNKDPISWMKSPQVAIYEEITTECDKSLYVDQVLADIIMSGRLIKKQSIPFFVSAPIRRMLFRQVDVDPSRRASTAADLLLEILNVKRRTLDWIKTDEGASAPFTGGQVRVQAGDVLRVEVNRGSGWRRDTSLEGASSAASCAAANARFVV